MRIRRAAVLVTGLVFCLAAPGQAAETSEVLRVPRPQGGEYFGLYLVDKKVGWYFTDLTPVPGKPQVRSVADFVFRAMVGNNIAERRHHEERIYESKPRGKLLSFVIKDVGDGGNQVLTGKAIPRSPMVWLGWRPVSRWTLGGSPPPAGFVVKRQRPGQADDSFTLPPVEETVEDSDQLRVALLRGKEVSGMALDGTDLGQYRMTTTPAAEERRVVNGVNILLRKATIVSEKEKVPMQAVVAPDGAVVEMSYGSAMIGRAEPKSVAQRLDKVEIFGLTRLVLPSTPPAAARSVPGELTLVVAGFPERFHRLTDRQTYKDLGGGKSEVTIRAAPPDPAKLVKRGSPTPPDTAEYLKTSILVESDNPAIVARAKEIAGGETDAYAAAKKVVAWVGRAMKKDYGASADRATDVLRTMRGDCTEHSLLSIALLRALGIPARRVDGVVYVQNEDGVPALYWHEWVEAWVGTWTQLDPTFGQPVADATHLTLGEESSAEIMPLLGELKVVAVR